MIHRQSREGWDKIAIQLDVHEDENGTHTSHWNKSFSKMSTSTSADIKLSFAEVIMERLFYSR